MNQYRIANLTPEQMQAIERMENQLHVTLIAWEPEGGTARPGGFQNLQEDDLVTNALVDTYRTFDPI